ncbi:MAG: GNAT family N-acetyltransferase [Pseudomonadota bacterium]
MIDLISPTASHRLHMQRWLTSDHVSRWWGDSESRLAQFDTTSPNNHAMIMRDGTPVGYLRWNSVSSDTLATVGLTDIPGGSMDVDIFIGTPYYSGRGIGPRALAILFDRLRAKTNAPLAGLCTSVDNARAHAAFRKAGCRNMTDFEDPEYGQCLVFTHALH